MKARSRLLIGELTGLSPTARDQLYHAKMQLDFLWVTDSAPEWHVAEREAAALTADDRAALRELLDLLFSAVDPKVRRSQERDPFIAIDYWYHAVHLKKRNAMKDIVQRRWSVSKAAVMKAHAAYGQSNGAALSARRLAAAAGAGSRVDLIERLIEDAARKPHSTEAGRS